MTKRNKASEDSADSVNFQKLETGPRTETELLEGFYHLFVEEGLLEEFEDAP